MRGVYFAMHINMLVYFILMNNAFVSVLIETYHEILNALVVNGTTNR